MSSPSSSSSSSANVASLQTLCQEDAPTTTTTPIPTTTAATSIVTADHRGGRRGGTKRSRWSERRDKHSRAKKLAKVPVALGEKTTLSDQVTPLWRLPYEKQLALKTEMARGVLRQIAQSIPDLPHQVEAKEMEDHASPSTPTKTTTTSSVMCCPLIEPVIPSVLVTGYRNKCEFTCGLNEDNQPTVGFRFGRFADGVLTVHDPTECLHVSQDMKTVARVVQDFMRNESKLPVYSYSTHVGFWRQVLVRQSFTAKTLMVVVQVDPQGADEEARLREITILKDRILSSGQLLKNNEESDTTATTNGEKPARISAILLQLNDSQTQSTSPDAPISLIWSESHPSDTALQSTATATATATACIIKERLLGKTFSISSSSFFQVNTFTTEVLYSLVRDWICEKPTEHQVLLDVCCGTGTIGQCLADHVKKVIGVDIVAEAIKDAEENARCNHISNVEYHTGAAEKVLPNLLKDSNTDFVAVVDPSRPGLHPKVVKALRNCSGIQRLVYVACNPTALAQDMLKLCGPTNAELRQPPFVPIKSTIVDLFPHTEHYEMVMLMERQQR